MTEPPNQRGPYPPPTPPGRPSVRETASRYARAAFAALIAWVRPNPRRNLPILIAVIAVLAVVSSISDAAKPGSTVIFGG